MPKKTKISEEDLAAFHQAMRGTKQLKQNKIRLASPQKQRKTHHTTSEFPSHYISEADDVHAVGGEEFIAYKQEGISNKTLRKLRKGQYNVEAILDLHGMSAEEAMAALDQFLQQCSRKGIRVVLIIHGKGQHSQEEPILKNKLNRWLRTIDSVLAFCSATPKHGSRGASYVLLRRAREENELE